jgi:phospholipase/lecithinase/hemolysin
MKNIRSWAAAVLTALLLVACGGGDPYVPGSGSPKGAPTAAPAGGFKAIVSFGTSASDIGTYAVATSLTGNGQPPYFGGKFTTNSATGTVWIENLAAALGIVITPAEIGFNGTSVAKCPAAANPALANTCTGYAQGGARITDPIGVGHDPVTNAGALTVPLVTQIDNHLARFTSFTDSDLIVVEGGINDLFVTFETFAIRVGTKQAELAAKVIAGEITEAEAETQLEQAVFFYWTTDEVEPGKPGAQAAMKQVALELAGYVRDKILANGGKYVAVTTVPDFRSTPFGQAVGAQSEEIQAVLGDLSRTFNLWLREGLTDQPVQIIDIYDVFNAVVANPPAGITNVTTPACDAAKINALTNGQVTSGSSLFCNSTAGAPYNTLATGASATEWFFADDVHPSTGGHKALSDFATEQLEAFGWI